MCATIAKSKAEHYACASAVLQLCNKMHLEVSASTFQCISRTPQAMWRNEE